MRKLTKPKRLSVLFPEQWRRTWASWCAVVKWSRARIGGIFWFYTHYSSSGAETGVLMVWSAWPTDRPTGWVGVPIWPTFVLWSRAACSQHTHPGDHNAAARRCRQRGVLLVWTPFTNNYCKVAAYNYRAEDGRGVVVGTLKRLGDPTDLCGLSAIQLMTLLLSGANRFARQRPTSTETIYINMRIHFKSIQFSFMCTKTIAQFPYTKVRNDITIYLN